MLRFIFRKNPALATAWDSRVFDGVFEGVLEKAGG
jgi:hypothetical protein